MSKTITIEELHTHTSEWINKVAGHDAISVSDGGQIVAFITPAVPSPKPLSGPIPWKHRVLLPESEAIMNKPVAGTDSTDIVSEMRDGQ